MKRYGLTVGLVLSLAVLLALPSAFAQGAKIPAESESQRHTKTGNGR